MKVLKYLLIVCPYLMIAQSYTDKIQKTLSFEKKSNQNALLIYNINGSISVESYEGQNIIVEIEKTITAKTNERLEEGKKAVQLGVLDKVDTLILFVHGTGQEFGLRSFSSKEKAQQYGYYHAGDTEGNYNNWDEPNYDYTMNFKIKLPHSIHVKASTVNKGDVYVQNVSGTIDARNVNGSIHLKQITSAKTNAHTINGDLTVEYSKNPSVDSKYYTLNGDLTILFSNPYNGTMSFKSFNGNLYTNIDALETMSPTVMKTASNKGTKFKIQEKFKIRSGSGCHLSVETFNGDAIIKEIIKQ